MWKNKLIFPSAGVSLGTIVLLVAQPLKAQPSSQSKEMEELTREIAELRQQVNKLQI
jgi:cell division protein FtsB